MDLETVVDRLVAVGAARCSGGWVLEGSNTATHRRFCKLIMLLLGYVSMIRLLQKSLPSDL